MSGWGRFQLASECFQRLNQVIPSSFWDAINRLQYHHNRQIHLMAMCVFQLCVPRKEVHKFISQQLELVTH